MGWEARKIPAAGEVFFLTSTFIALATPAGWLYEPETPAELPGTYPHGAQLELLPNRRPSGTTAFVDTWTFAGTKVKLIGKASKLFRPGSDAETVAAARDSAPLQQTPK